ncbi:MAG: putative lipid II flippase FtsW [Candidatus Sungbacteria bacterium]|nr:putative lipid II flippase FtsW [Candidatus Sungbacteria bacterium]
MSRPVDRPLFTVILLLVFSGVLIISSASVVISDRNFGTTYYYTLRHLLSLGIGLCALFITSRLPYKAWRKLALLLMVISLVLTALVFFPGVGFRHGGASRWLDVGFFSFQPSEFLKIALVIYLASWLSSRRDSPKDTYRAFLPFVVILGIVSVLLVLQPDIGTLLVVAFTATALYFLGGGKVSQIVSLFVLGMLSLAALVQLAPYRLARFAVFLNPDVDPSGIGYHIRQALIAIGSGGFWGRGYGQGLQKYNYLPEPIGDSIFAIAAEEFGFFGVMVLIGFFVFFVWRSILIARSAPDTFSKLIVAGFAASIGFQAFINMGAISGLLPLTGIPLPFISYGGTALITTLFATGIVLNVSRYT